LGLKKVGRAYGKNIEMCLYELSLHCKEKDKVKYFTVEFEVRDEKNGEGVVVVDFWTS